MLKKSFLKLMTKITLIVFVLLVSNLSAFAVADMTPYPSYQPPNVYLQAAQYEFGFNKDIKERMRHDLIDMRNNYNINSLSLYGIENLRQDRGELDLLFHLLDSLGMHAIIRIEWYEKTPTYTFKFRNSDADKIIAHYESVLAYACSDIRRNYVAYFALNVPVDDPEVADQYPLGRQDPAWKSDQKAYVDYFVSAMRQKCQSYGFNDAKQYVSVFYGWDYGYDIPSYSSSNANGYFLWNCTYPQDKANPPSENDPEHVIINRARLQQGMDKFMGQYPLASQEKVIEYALHSSEFNNWRYLDQDAGLVKSKAAKKIALTATNSYYNASSFPGLKGTVYFSYNLLKKEGNPEVLLDFCLNYPEIHKTEAENSTFYGNVRFYNDGAASNGKGASGFEATGDALAIFQSSESNAVKIRYACSTSTQLSLYIDGQYRQRVNFPSTGAWTGAYDTAVVFMNIPWAATIRLQRNSDDGEVNIDYVDILESKNVNKNEAENGSFSGGAQPYDDGAASGSRGAGSLNGSGAAVSLSNASACGSFGITYAVGSPTNGQLSLYVNGTYKQKVAFPPTGGWTGVYSTVTVTENVPAGATITLQHDGGSDAPANIDYLQFLLISSNRLEAETGGFYKQARPYGDGAASNGKGAGGLNGNGDALVMTTVLGGNSLGITYASQDDGQLGLYIDGVFKQKVSFPQTGAWTGTYNTITVNVNVPVGATIKLQNDGDSDKPANIDYFTFGSGSSTLKKGNNLTDAPDILPNPDLSINVFPNPFENELKITISEASEFKTLHVMDEAGKLLEIINIEGPGQLNIGSNYKPGTYLLRFFSQKGDESKIVIKR